MDRKDLNNLNFDENKNFKAENLNELNILLSDLAQNQEPLETEFSKVLFDNIPELYQS